VEYPRYVEFIPAALVPSIFGAVAGLIVDRTAQQNFSIHMSGRWVEFRATLSLFAEARCSALRQWLEKLF
jgi:hypothetical protein